MQKNRVIVFLVSILFVSLSAKAQLVPVQKIAPFNIKLTNGQSYTANQMAKGPTVLIYFSPDCDHCVDFTEDLLKNYSVIANKQVVMVTFQDMKMLKPFVQKFKLSQYPNIKVGTEGNSFTVQRYYKIRSFPYIAIYDKNGNPVRTYEGVQSHAAIFNTLKNI